ncbi:hypothetical protein B8V81_1487 [Paenibacillus pasadenensis]|uniref:Uncharacterized protein n=1 Tax=Paenibacillus pasadenensis TaxID=217090 RepID=A0A2N5NAA0_9BACL|nr:hypothetical protein B8V81_1487 [Paenibacillus pasadenensis]
MVGRAVAFRGCPALENFVKKGTFPCVYCKQTVFIINLWW